MPSPQAMERPQRFSDCFRYNINTFKVTGIWINLKNLKQTPRLTIYYCLIVNMLFLLAPQVCHVIYMYKARNNVEDFADEFYVSLTSLIVVFKSFSLVTHFDIINKLINSMDKEIFQAKNICQINLTKKAIREWKKIYWFYAYLAISFCFLQLSAPIIDRFLHGTHVLPLVDCYPFEIFPSPTYEVMFIYQSGVLFCLVIQNFNLDTLITGLLAFATLECEMLCDGLENLKLELLDNNEDCDKIKIMEKKLIQCIKLHQEISGFLKDVDYCFSLNLFEQFACSVITFCTTMFKFSLAEPMSQEFFAIIFYQTACFLELFVFCWSGTALTIQSEKIQSAAYECDWVDCSRALKSNLSFFLQNCQKPFEIRAIFIPVSHETFLQILKTSFSYYTVLATLNEK